jgi:tetraacyldisaccharide 4'-kinase
MQFGRYVYRLASGQERGFVAVALKCLLYVLSLVYGLIVKVLIFYRRLKPYRLDCKVISVGNITLGGTGKTPLVEFIARYLKQQGHRLAVLSRGYKKKSDIKSQNLKLSYETMGDEAYMLSQKLPDIPVLVDANRIKTARQATEGYKVDTVVLDDGFQQWGIAKDLEIVTLDATNPFGNRHMLPRGILRQPLSALRDVDIFVLTKVNLMPSVVNQTASLGHPEAIPRVDTGFSNPAIDDLEGFLNRINPEALIIEAIYKPRGFYKLKDSQKNLFSPQILKGETVVLVSGIADPTSFENLILGLGINIGLSFKFPDHYYFTQKDLKEIVKESKENNINTLITTEKDAVRLFSMNYELSMNSLVLAIELRIIQNEKELYRRLHKLYYP